MNANGSVEASVTLKGRPERRLIRPGGSARHIDFRLAVTRPPQNAASRIPINLALVLDRSGSMSGRKIETAKFAAGAVLDRLVERDQVAVVIFDDQIDVLQAAAPASAAVKSRIRAELARMGARGSTALHEGWLTGCRAIASDSDQAAGRLSHCFLLTDGLANVGLTDPELIATEAGAVRRNGAVGTSTFGIGDDYAEALLGPMAVAGEGQFHHLRTTEDIVHTFIGELGELLAMAVQQVRLDLEYPTGVTPEVISAYRSEIGTTAGSIGIGDLLAGEERHVVVRFRFPAEAQRGHAIRARLVSRVNGAEVAGDWVSTDFLYADDAICDAEQRDPEAMHWIGLHQAERARRQATDFNRSGNVDQARYHLDQVAKHIAEYAGSDAALSQAVDDLNGLDQQLAARPLAAPEMKEMYFRAQSASRGQRDHRKK